eukprot:COSAG03_NODE_537_length_7096_cov_15.736744_5_plen_73_part_00
MSGKGNALAEKLEDATDGKKKKKTRCARSLSPSLPPSLSLSPSLSLALPLSQRSSVAHGFADAVHYADDGTG